MLHETNSSKKSKIGYGQDHFSAIAKEYDKGRIEYPLKLYSFLAHQCTNFQCAWDCATGSGQAAIKLANVFEKVVATDISKELLELAPEHPKISYHSAPAENSKIKSSSIDLITIGQAYHWFEFDPFWEEAIRVLKPDGVVAILGYLWPETNPEVDGVLERFKQEIQSHWPERSILLHEGYQSIYSPLTEISSPKFQIQTKWSLEEYLSHLKSWSGNRYFEESTKRNAIEELKEDFKLAWGKGTKKVKWPLIARVFKK